MLGVVTMELMIVTRYWTGWFAFVCVFSYTLVYPFVLVFPLLQSAWGTVEMAHFGIGVNIMHTPFFWIALLTVYSITFSIRYFERSMKWLFRPDDNMIRAELEVLNQKDPDLFNLYEQNAASAVQLSPPPPPVPPADDPDLVRCYTFLVACETLQLSRLVLLAVFVRLCSSSDYASVPCIMHTGSGKDGRFMDQESV